MPQLPAELHIKILNELLEPIIYDETATIYPFWKTLTVNDTEKPPSRFRSVRWSNYIDSVLTLIQSSHYVWRLVFRVIAGHLALANLKRDTWEKSRQKHLTVDPRCQKDWDDDYLERAGPCGECIDIHNVMGKPRRAMFALEEVWWMLA